MKIGILTMHKIPNYGSFLQAFSLKKEFESRGHEVFFIDFEQGKIINPPKNEKIDYFKKFDRYFLKRIQNYILFAKMTKIHRNDHTVFLESEKKIAENEKYDLAVIGSDEVFSATAPTPWGFTTQLFGDIKNAESVVTYAASCGTTTFETAEKFGITDEIRTAMQNLKMISVRDQNSFDFVKAIMGTEPQINLDPVFLANYDSYIVTPKTKKPYLLIYAYGNRICDKKEIAAIKQYAEKNGLEILSVGMQQRWCRHNIAATAFELLGYVKNAECIVTDTFHGTVFSVKYNKKFVTLIRESNKQKLGGLLEIFGLYNRVVLGTETLPQIMDAEIDYERVNDFIKSEQEKAKKYLDKACGKV